MMLFVIWIILVVHVEVSILVVFIIFPSWTIPSSSIMLSVIVLMTLLLFVLFLLHVGCVIVASIWSMLEIVSIYMIMSAGFSFIV